jgi:hypothetical protein
MVTKCANPKCEASFDHRQGRLFRFPKSHFHDGLPANTHSVQHFWLCGACSQRYALQYDAGHGVAMTGHFEKKLTPGRHHFIAAA